MRPNAVWIALVSVAVIVLVAGCETTPTQQGAVIGGATGAGLGAKGETRRNFELGVLTHDAAMLDRVAALFHRIWEGLMCADCGRQSVCYVPLEEPS